MKGLCTLAFVLALATATAAQRPPARRSPPRPPLPPAPSLSLRPFVMGTEQSFSAVNTFDAVHGQSYEPFFGGGLEVVFRGTYYAEAAASRFKKTGERAFRSNGENFRLGLPLTTEITPLEITGGYRFRMRRLPRVVPYAGAGFGSYAYKETSPSSDSGENVDARHSGVLVTGGAEFRVHPWVGIAVDAAYTHVPGILGAGGVSKQAGENDLGGLAARFKVIVGR
jgi:hypothetical protein